MLLQRLKPCWCSADNRAVFRSGNRAEAVRVNRAEAVQVSSTVLVRVFSADSSASSCAVADQSMFAVSVFLLTGKI